MKYIWSIIGHEKQLEQIERDIESGNLAHAYLLAGPNSVGKHTVAKKFAGILQCENDFCQQCAICTQVQKGTHIDTIELEDDHESIKIEAVRKIVERLNMTRQAKYKIFLVQSLERMTTEAANSFLKILEEPPEGTIFILTTNHLRALLPTIVSRVRVVNFGTVSAEYLKGQLQGLFPDADEDVIDRVSLFSMGKTGEALKLMERPEFLADYMKVYHDVQNFLNHRSVVDRFSYVDYLLEEGDEKRADLFFNILTHVLRSKILEGAPETEKYVNVLRKVSEAGNFLQKNVNSRLVLENLMLAL